MQEKVELFYLLMNAKFGTNLTQQLEAFIKLAKCSDQKSGWLLQTMLRDEPIRTETEE